MKNAAKLREELCEVCDKLKTGDLSPGTAREMIKSTTAQISIAKVQIEYASICNVKPSIPFLDFN
jgi:hypothetical protein